MPDSPIFHVSPFRLPFTVNWNTILEFPDYAQRVITACCRNEPDSAITAVSGYGRIYGGGALYDEVVVDRVPYCFGPAFIISVPDILEAAAALSDAPAIRDAFGADDRVSLSRIRLSLFGFNLGVLQFEAAYPDSGARVDQLGGRTGQLGFEWSNAIERRWRDEVAALLTRARACEQEVRGRRAAQTRLFPDPDEAVNRELLDLSRYDAGRERVLWTHRVFFREKVSPPPGVSLTGVERIALPRTDGLQVLPSDGRTVFIGSADNFYSNQLDAAMCVSHYTYACYDSFRTSSELLRLRMDRTASRKAAAHLTRLAAALDQTQDHLDQQLPVLDAAYKDPRKTMFQSLQRVFRFEAVRAGAEAAAAARRRVLDKLLTGFADRARRRSEMSLYFISFLSFFGLGLNILWFAKGSFDPEIERGQPGFYMGVLERVAAAPSELALLVMLLVTLMLAWALIRR